MDLETLLIVLLGCAVLAALAGPKHGHSVKESIALGLFLGPFGLFLSMRPKSGDE